MASTERVRKSLKLSVLLELIGIGIVIAGISDIIYFNTGNYFTTISVGILFIATGSILFYRYYEGETLAEQLMYPRTTLTEADVGKQVLTADGERVGRITEIEDEIAYISPSPHLSDETRSRLGWDDEENSSHSVDENSVESNLDDEVRLVVA